jgi:hypothetical protein
MGISKNAEARSCHTLLVPGGAIAGRLPCSFSFPGLIRSKAPMPIKADCDARTLAQTMVSVQCEISGWETDGYTL